MFLKIGKLLTRNREKYWNNLFELMIFFSIKEGIHKRHVRIFNIIIANYGIESDEIAVNRIEEGVIYGLKNDNIECYFLYNKNKIIIPLWKK